VAPALVDRHGDGPAEGSANSRVRSMSCVNAARERALGIQVRRTQGGRRRMCASERHAARPWLGAPSLASP
jgi:hypothetical protein